jgi:ATP-dependent Lon protease
LPYNDLTLEVGRSKSIEALLFSGETEDLIILSPQEDTESDFPEKEDIYHIGLVAKVVNQMRQPNGHYRVKFKVLMRAQIEEVFDNDSFFKALISTMPSFSEVTGDEEVMGRMLLKEINNPASKMFSRS